MLDKLSQIIIAAGYIGIFATVFAESGFLLGFFLPGDSLLFTVGILASQGYFNIYYLIIGSVLAAILGDSFGYYLGRRFGPAIFNRPDSLLFKKENVRRTENFFNKYGKKTIILARFVPIVRTFAPIMAGVGNMKYRTFLSFNVIGGTVWAGGFLAVSFWLGTKFAGVQHYLSYIIIAIIAISVIPITLDFIRRK